MPDYDVQLFLIDVERDPPDDHFIVLVTAQSFEEAENKAIAHYQSVTHPPLAWERFEGDDGDVTWFEPGGERQIHLESNADRVAEHL